MRAILAVIGAFAIGIAAIIGALFFIGKQRSGPLLEAAHAYTDEAVPAITAEWNGDALWSRAAPELMMLLENGAVEELMGVGSFQMDRLVNYEKPLCVLTAYEIRSGTGERAFAQCTGKAEYKRITARYTLNVVMRDKEWRILGFFIEAEKESGRPAIVSYRSNLQDRDISIGFALDKLSVSRSPGASLEAGAEIAARSRVEIFE